MARIAFVFPGQGAQKLGMGQEIFERFEVAREAFDIASESLGYSMQELVFDSSEDKLRMTEYTQPSILTVSIAIAKVLESYGIVPEVCAGLSLGEYSALVHAGSIRFEDAVRIVTKRGQFMQSEVPDGIGAMAAILGLGSDLAQKACSEALGEGIAVVANYNCPGQIVIAGNKDKVESALEKCKEYGSKKAVMLPVSAPFHTPLLAGAGQKLGQELDKYILESPKTKVISNVTVLPYESDIKDLLVRQVSSPVRWEESVRKMIDMGIDTFIEVGPGDSLSKFIRKIDRSMNIYNVSDLATLFETLKAVKGESYEF